MFAVLLCGLLMNIYKKYTLKYQKIQFVHREYNVLSYFIFAKLNAIDLYNTYL